MTYWPAKQSNSVRKRKKRLWRRSRSFKVIEVGISRKPVCDFQLVINSNWHHISYRFGVIEAYCSNFGHFAFFSHLLGLRDNIRCSSWVRWKARSGLPISVNWTFLLGVTAEELRAKIDRKSAISLQRDQFDPKSPVEGDVPHQLFLHG